MKNIRIRLVIGCVAGLMLSVIIWDYFLRDDEHRGAFTQYLVEAIFPEPSGLLSQIDGTDFAVKDVSSIDKIFIADMKGQVTLTRSADGMTWLVNDRYRARDESIALVLKTIKGVSVKAPVSEKMKATVIRNMAAGGKKVEIYQGGNRPVKTWIVGTSTPNHAGTYMVLEKDGQVGEDPYVIHMEGNYGYLTPRFFTSEREWRHTGVFNFSDLERVEFDCFENPEESYALQVLSNGQLGLEDASGQTIPFYDVVEVQDHFNRFKKVHLETYDSHMDAVKEDSLRSTNPAFRLTALGKSGDEKHLDVYWKPRTGLDRNELGDLMEHDGERMYGVTEGNEVVLLQRFVFDPLLRTRSELQQQVIPPVASAGLPIPTN